jgi:autotransporter-associated beta strand protein
LNSPGILDLNGFVGGVSIGTLSGNGTIDNVSASGNPSVVIGVDGLNETFNGIIADTTGTLTVYKEGSATTTLAGVSTYTGDTYIASGSLLAGVTNSIPAASNIFFESGGSNDLIMGDNVTVSSPITIGSGIGSGGELIAYPGALDADVAGNISLVGGGGQFRMGIFGTGTLWFTGITSFNTNQFCFLDAGALGYTGNGGLLVPNTTLGIGRSTGNAVATFFEGNATVTANGVSTAEGVSMTNMYVEVDGSANVQVTGEWDMENSTNTASSSTITLNGGTLGAAYFSQTQSLLSPGNDEGGQNLPTGPVQGTYMNLNGGVLLQTAQIGTNAFLAQNLNNLDITLGSGGALFDSNGLVMSVSVPMETAFLADGGVQKLGLGSLVLSGINTTFGTASNYVGPILVKGGLLQFVDTQGMGATNLGPTYVPHMTVNAGGAAGMEGGTITSSGGSNAAAFLTVLNQNGLASFGGLALDPADATDNISYTAAYAGAVTTGGTFGMNNTVLSHMSIGAQSAGVTYTGTITPSGGSYLLGGGGTLTLPNANALTGANAATYENGGSVQVLNTNNYTGITTITGGYVMADPFFTTQPYQSTSLTVAALANGGSPSSLGQSNNAATSLIIQGGTLQFVGTSSGSTDRLFTIGSAGATLNASGTVAMNMTNTGTEAEGADTGQSGTTVGVGSAIINNVSTAGLTLGTIVSDTGGLFPAGVSIVGLTPNSITLSQPATGNSNNDSLNFTNQLRALTLTGTSAPAIINTISSTLADASTGALSLVKNGSNTWLVNGTNTYTGGTIVNAGDLQINSAQSMGNLSGSVTLNAGTLETVVGGIVSNRSFFLGTGSPTSWSTPAPMKSTARSPIPTSRLARPLWPVS